MPQHTRDVPLERKRAHRESENLLAMGEDELYELSVEEESFRGY